MEVRRSKLWDAQPILCKENTTWICLEWLEMKKKHIPNGGLVVIYEGKT